MVISYSECLPRPGRTAVPRFPGTEICGEEGPRVQPWSCVHTLGPGWGHRQADVPRVQHGGLNPGSWGGEGLLPPHLMGLPLSQGRPRDLVDKHAGRRCGRPLQLDFVPRQLYHRQLARAGDFPWKRETEAGVAEGPPVFTHSARRAHCRTCPGTRPHLAWRCTEQTPSSYADLKCPGAQREAAGGTHVWSGGQ